MVMASNPCVVVAVVSLFMRAQIASLMLLNH